MMLLSSLLRRHRLLVMLAAIAFPLALLSGDAPVQTAERDLSHGKLLLHKGDHISLIGNTLADRMQHDGWLETYLASRYPTHDLVVRNLGFSGDELTLRLRSSAFGSPDDWLRANKTDVVFAFFGYNESFADREGLKRFKTDLAGYLKHLQGQKYNGKAAPRIVLFSPIAHEQQADPNLPDGKENNRRIALYTAAMAEVAAANKVSFVDLYRPTLTVYPTAKQPLTINGIHLNEAGNEAVARIIDGTLFAGKPAGKRDARTLEALRRAVIDKDFYWFNRYRTVDGYSIFGGRADLRFVEGQTNREVMQREMLVLDEMTANRDKVIWARAQGRDLKADDSNTSPFIPVRTNKPGPLPGGKHVFLDADQSIERMTVAKGLKVTPFASEREFPELVNPVQMTFDGKGRLWVAVWPTYPHWKPKEPMNDKILILEDTNNDGKADKCTVFADDLHCPTGLELWNGGVLVAQTPDLLFLKDSDGDGKADTRRRVLSGLDSADTHHAVNSFVLDPGGALYMQEGTFHHTQVETPWGPPRRCANAGVFRYEPRAQKFDVYVSFGFANPHGHVFDRWGQDIVVDGTGAQPYHAALFSGHLPFPQKHGRPPQVYQQRTRPCPGMEYLSSRHFPDDMNGNLLVGNVIGFQGILQYKIRDDGASFAGSEVDPIVSSTDPNFRPSDLKVGPDGAIWFIDWHNPIIGHMQHNLRDPSRDRDHGRVYRITYPTRQLLTSPPIAGEPLERLLDVLKQPEDRVRYRARSELTARPTTEVIAAAKKWLAGLDRDDKEYEHHVLEGLWLHQSHNVVDVDLLGKVLTAKDFRARAAATRVLCYWRDRVPDALALLRKQAADEHPRVRLEAVRAASFFTEAEALEVVLISRDKPSDMFIDFVRDETMKALQPHVNKAVSEGRKIKFTTPTGARFFLRTVNTEDLMKMERSQGVYLELLFRKGVRDEFRREALLGLAKLEKQDELRVLLSAIADHDAQEASADESVAFDLIRLLSARPTSELAAARAALEKLATSARQPVTRQLGFVTLIAADDGIDKAWALATRSLASLDDLVHAVPLVRDAGQRAALYPRVAALLSGLPKELATKAVSEKAATGRYVRIELTGPQRTLTLAEVEVFSDGTNVARRGKATQSSTGAGGPARKAIDGNKSGIYTDGGQTHTREGTRNPWWEVDLGRDYPIQSIVVYNRNEGNLGTRLKDYTVKILTADRKVAFQKERNPAPESRAEHAVGLVSPERLIRRAAMQALPSVRGLEAETAKLLVRFLKDDSDRAAAVTALQRLPAREWPKELARPALEDLLAAVRTIPVSERTQTSTVDALQLADTLAGLLPIDEARKTRRQLGELGVRVIRLGTLLEQMMYDKERIVVQAGKPFEVFFENTDTMPHNVVIIEPGSLEEVGNLAETSATQPGAMDRQYVPPSKKVLVASRLIQPRESQRLAWTAPSKAGVYPFVCTFPGHWRRMHGALYVVEDLEAYQADPAAYLAKSPLPIADPLLKFSRPRTEWKFEELAPLAKNLSGRSYSTGRQMFTVATCVGCHKLGGQGAEFGPDLTKLDPKWGPVDVLQHLLDPALKIDDKYRVYTFQLDDGKTLTGMILEENADTVKIIDNPLLAVARPIVLKKANIEQRVKSPSSLMPKGLLDKLTREEILDLLGYVVSGAGEKHKVYQGGHDHGAHGHHH